MNTEPPAEQTTGQEPGISTEEQTTYPLRQIYFYLTEGCNQRCRHCWIAPKYQGEGKSFPSLPIELFRLIVDQAKPLGLAGVKLTGGEPLLHPDIDAILDHVRAEELRLTVETNGVLCTEKLARKMKDCQNSFVSVSLDGADAETHEWMRGVTGCFQEGIEGVGNLVKAGFKPQIIMSVMKRNQDQLEAVVRLAESLGAGSVKFNVVQPTSRGEKMHEARNTLTIEELVKLGDRVEKDLSQTTDLRLVFSHPAAFQPMGRMFGGSGGGCGVCGIKGILGVLSDGSYALCGIGESVQELIFGKAGTDDLETVWKNTAVLEQIRQGLPQKLEGICGQCLMKGMCLGSCIAQNYYSSKNLWAPFWYCEAARKTKLFPETRIIP
ncbi:MAG: SynChlorMet cassette radical SAM/SPASM protein ScmF [Proteobacteria bacterium]|nr:SynChlorMet cassette radical SAM/SPASM protein ScmF [Pseudomonadota bacterium]